MNSPLPLAGEAAPQARVRVENSTRESRNYFSVSHPHPNPLPPAGEGELRARFVFRLTALLLHPSIYNVDTSCGR